MSNITWTEIVFWLVSIGIAFFVGMYKQDAIIKIKLHKKYGYDFDIDD